MENEEDISSKVKTWAIVGGVALITFILVFTVTNKLINGNKKKTTTMTPTETVKYSSYKVGDEVTLSDGSNWHVLYDSKDNTEYLTLLSDEDVNSSGVLYGNINSFLKGTYKSSLVSSLNCSSTDIQELRLLAYLDLADVSNYNSSEFLPEALLSKFNFPEWIYLNNTVTDTVYQTDEANSPVMICKADAAPVVENGTENNITSESNLKGDRFCLGDSTISLPVRPVIVLSKKILKTTTTNNYSTDVSNMTGDK